MATRLREGSLFTGYGGLSSAACEHFSAETVWTSDIDPGACKIIAHRYPDVPNLGDITTVDWTQVEPVDILTGGFPCQDLSHAGKRAGMHDGTRSGLWSHMANAIDKLRPRWVVAENVRGLLSAGATSDLEPCPWCMGEADDREPDLRALGCVLGDLAELGYDARWYGLRAADVGAPHGRFRIFVLATDTRGQHRNERFAAPGQAKSGRTLSLVAGHGRAPIGNTHGGDRYGWPAARQQGETRPQTRSASDADAAGPQGTRASGHGAAQPKPVGAGLAAADPAGDGRHEGWPEPARQLGGSDAALSGDAATDANHRADDWERPRAEPWEGGSVATDATSTERRGAEPEHSGSGLGPAAEPGERTGPIAWGDYEPAIRRWERVLDRPAPAPTETGPKGGQRLSTRFVEHMMGVPAGWVTDVPGLSRNAQLKALGNGVVPQQALAALRTMSELEAAA